MKCTVSHDTDNQLSEEANDDTLGYLCEWENALDGMDEDPLDIPDGHLVHHTHVDVNHAPPDLSELPSKCARVEEEDNGHSPCWPSFGHFTEQYTSVAATILGKKRTMFECLEAAELEKDESKWAPFHNEDEWELAPYLMKDLGQKKIDELLKLSHVSE